LTSATERNRAKEDAKTSLRDDLEAALSGAATGDLTNIAKQMRRVGLNFDAEAGRIRSKLIQQGLSLLPPTERDKVYGQPESYNPEALITRATNARRGRPTAVAERGDVRLTRDATAPPASDTPIRAEARRQLEAARKASGDVRPVTDADVNQILAKPGNLAKLKQAVSAR
jgi:hypothetical protein